MRSLPLLLLLGCAEEPIIPVVDLDGDGSVAPADCDDHDSSVFPSATEVCDGIDNDCDGVTDNSGSIEDGGALDARGWFRDADGDGYGTANDTVRACSAPEGYLNAAGDCDDTDAEVSPEGSEVCDDANRDEDCDGASDDNDEDATGQTTWYADPDGDGYGSPLYTLSRCDQPASYTDNADDCLEGDAGTHPGAEEIWYDGIDQDCDDASDWDADGDGWDLGEGEDCDDVEAAINPDAEERCGDGVDQDCNGTEIGCSSSLSIARAVLFGAAAGDRAGQAIAPTGDLNGDGAIDLWVGADLADGTKGADQGSIYLATSPWGGERNLGVSPWIWQGAAAGETAGHTIAGDFDADGDGRPDLLIGAPYAGSAARAGGVYLLLGPASGGELADADGFWEGGESAMAGEAVAVAGDVDGDGLDDLLVGGPWDDTIDSQAGVVFLLRGPATAGGQLEDASAVLWAEAAGDQAGTAVAGDGDLDGDGLSDIAIGAWWADPGARQAGLVYIQYGPIEGEQSLAESDHLLAGEERSDKAGTSLAFVGDLDGDGLDDLLIGASGIDEVGDASGGAYVIHGPASATSVGADEAVLLGEFEDGLAGWSVGAAGDVDGDGTPDLLVGAPGAEGGAAYLVLGPVSGRESLGVQRLRLEGEESGDGAGISVAGAGDLDGDALDDLVVGAWNEGTTGEGAGAVYIILSQDLE